jgi:hypothetical protein
MAPQTHDSRIPTLAKVVTAYHVLILLAALGVCYQLIYCNNCFFNNQLYSKHSIICLCFGVIGGTLNSSRWVVKAVKDGKYYKNRVLWQVLTPIHSGVFAVIALSFIKAGFNFAYDQTATPVPGPNYTEYVAVVSFLVGFSSEIFIKRMISATEALFGERDSIDDINKSKVKGDTLIVKDEGGSNGEIEDGK